jgi:hypothetical protein
MKKSSIKMAPKGRTPPSRIDTNGRVYLGREERIRTRRKGKCDNVGVCVPKLLRDLTGDEVDADVGGLSHDLQTEVKASAINSGHCATAIISTVNTSPLLPK